MSQCNVLAVLLRCCPVHIGIHITHGAAAGSVFDYAALRPGADAALDSVVACQLCCCSAHIVAGGVHRDCAKACLLHTRPQEALCEPLHGLDLLDKPNVLRQVLRAMPCARHSAVRLQRCTQLASRCAEHASQHGLVPNCRASSADLAGRDSSKRMLGEHGRAKRPSGGSCCTSSTRTLQYWGRTRCDPSAAGPRLSPTCEQRAADAAHPLPCVHPRHSCSLDGSTSTASALIATSLEPHCAQASRQAPDSP